MPVSLGNILFLGGPDRRKRRSPLLIKPPGHPASERFTDQVDQALRELPSSLRQGLHRKGWRVMAGRFLSDVFPNLSREKDPRGWDSQDTWDYVDAACDANLRRIGIAQFVWNRESNGKSVFDNDFPSYYRSEEVLPPVRYGDAYLERVTAPERLVRHEAGHAVDTLLSDASASRRFREAYRRDFDAMGRDVRKKLYYYIQPDKKGRPTRKGMEEAFAECFAALHGGGCDYVRNIRRHFGHTIAFIQNAIRSYEQKQARKRARKTA